MRSKKSTQPTPQPKAASRTAKRARFATEEKTPRGASPVILIAGLVIIAAILGGAVFAFMRPTASAANGPESPADVPAAPLTGYRTGSQGLLVAAATIGHDPYPLVEPEDGAVRLPLATFDDLKAHHYTYMHEGRPIEFFVLKSKDGIVRAAFNACDVCFPAKKGYTQDGDYMVCNNCGRRFPADQINVVQGGCNPSPLDRAVQGDTLVIQVEDIVKGQGYF
jgi:hypothetical protein